MLLMSLLLQTGIAVTMVVLGRIQVGLCAATDRNEQEVASIFLGINANAQF